MKIIQETGSCRSYNSVRRIGWARSS